MNAAVAQGVPAAEIGRHFDTVTLCLSKGLGCPLGALIAGSAERMQEARRNKHLFGGAMRQAGIVAAAGVYALERQRRAARRRPRARPPASRGARRRRAAVDLDQVETNFVQVDIGPDRSAALDALRAAGRPALGHDPPQRPARGHLPGRHRRRHRAGDRADPPRAGGPCRRLSSAASSPRRRRSGSRRSRRPSSGTARSSTPTRSGSPSPGATRPPTTSTGSARSRRRSAPPP